MALCNPMTKTKEERMDAMSKVYDYWIGKKNIVQRFGGDNYNGFSSAKYMKEWIQQRIEKPFDSDSPLTEADYRRIMVEIDSFDRALGGKFSNLAFVVPELISQQDPVSRKFYLKLNDILNYERTQINKVITDNIKIADHMFDAYITEFGGKRGYGKKGTVDPAITELRRLRQEMAEADPSEHTEAEFINKLENFIAKNPDPTKDKGKTIREFHELVEMSNAEFQEARKPSFRNSKGELVTYNSHVYQAVKKARNNLNEMAKVYIQGLTGLQKIIALKYENHSDVNTVKDKQALRMIDIINKSIIDIKAGIDPKTGGGYFPHVQFDTLLQTRERLAEAMIANVSGKDYAFSNMVDNVISGMDLKQIPAHAKKTNPLLEQYYERDPLMVLKEYGDQATQFNKLIHTQITYLEALKHLPKDDSEFTNGLKRFIQEEYAVFTLGSGGRNEWANKAVTTLNAIQTARTMGLNITGAVKNAASAIHFYSKVGIGALSATKKAYDHETEKGGFRETMDKIEEEAGFLFTDAAKELYTEGLITRKDMETGKVVFDPITGKVTIEGNPLKDHLKTAGRWTLDKALYFHRITENSQRKWMFRTAFHKKYSQLVNDGYDPQKSKVFAKNYALRMVNGWAYEYAAHAKSKMVRGEWRTIDEIKGTEKDAGGKIVRRQSGDWTGAGSEVAFHLLHYPMSLAATHYENLKGIHKAILAKQGLESEEIQYAMRYAGVSIGIAIASAMTNIDFTNIIENESIERVQRVVDDVAEYDNPDKGTFGLMSEFTGPTLGFLKYMAVSQEIIDIDHSDLNKILFGNVDFSDDSDKLTDLYTAYQFSTAWGMIKNKFAPTIKSGRGRDLVTHWLKLYPNKWTKRGHEFMFGKKKKKQKKRQTGSERALAVLEGMRR